jgi:hypothetical protein
MLEGWLLVLRQPLSEYRRLQGERAALLRPRAEPARMQAELGRLDCRKNFPFGAEWNGHPYATKQVRPVFVDEPNEIVVITVYTYYF